MVFFFAVFLNNELDINLLVTIQLLLSVLHRQVQLATPVAKAPQLPSLAPPVGENHRPVKYSDSLYECNL